MDTNNEAIKLNEPSLNSHIYEGCFVLSYEQYLIDNKLTKPDNKQFRTWAQQVLKYFQSEAEKEHVCQVFEIQGTDADDVMGGKYLIQISKIENFPDAKNVRFNLTATVGKSYDDDNTNNYLEAE